MNIVTCPLCSSTKIIRKGLRRNGEQSYKCTICSRNFQTEYRRQPSGLIRLCASCGTNIPTSIYINGKRISRQKRTLCWQCKPNGTRTRIKKTCPKCGNNIVERHSVYCSSKCHRQQLYDEYICRWIAGNESGSNANLGVSARIKKYLRLKYGNKCQICGWAEVNKTTGNVPVEVDHIDGDPTNNNENNLRLLCPNCHSLTPTYRALNKGNGREVRRTKYVRVGVASVATAPHS